MRNKLIYKCNLKLACLVLFFSLRTTAVCVAQNYSSEFWPETDIWYKLNSAWRLSTFVPITKYNESESSDINIYLNVDYAWGHAQQQMFWRMVDKEKLQILKVWMVRAGFMKGWGLRNNTNYAEDMIFSELHRRIPLINDMLISHRCRVDTRWLGQDNNFSYRFRYRLMIEKEYKSGHYSIVPYVNIEPYWDSRYSRVVRTRAISGVTTSFGNCFAIEGNLTYQYDETYDTQGLYALNIILHIFLERSKMAR